MYNILVGFGAILCLLVAGYLLTIWRKYIPIVAAIVLFLFLCHEIGQFLCA